ncbi:MAG TPA: hypothetical protein PK530_20235 [Anaerolineales bacterium]|nr:hypothetical protein [Anaerolineales bacterium]
MVAQHNPVFSPNERWLTISLIAITAFATFVLYFAYTAHPSENAPLFRTIPALEQFVLVMAVYPIKLLYMLLALGATILLWKETTRPLTALRWSMAFFLFGEVVCWFNILFFFEENLLLEYLHSWGMIACLGFLVYAVLEALDSHVFHFSAPDAKCALAGVCHKCAKFTEAPCALERFFKWSLPIGILLAWMPLSAPVVSMSYNTQVFGFARNLSHDAVVQYYELRYAPWASVLLIGAAWFLTLWRGRRGEVLRVAKILLAAGAGHLLFAFLRLAFFAFYRDHLVWFVFWEEFTELILVGSVWVSLWTFQPGFFARWVKILPG